MAAFVFFAGTAWAGIISAYAGSGFGRHRFLLFALGRGCSLALSRIAGKFGFRCLVVIAGGRFRLSFLHIRLAGCWFAELVLGQLLVGLLRGLRCGSLLTHMYLATHEGCHSFGV